MPEKPLSLHHHENQTAPAPERSQKRISAELLLKRHRETYAGFYQRLVAAAAEARDSLAYSYRDFLVGCSVLAWNKEKDEYHIFSAGNYLAGKRTLRPGQRKDCAERLAIEGAEAAGYNSIVAIVTVSSEKNTDAANDEDNATLKPCRQCRDFFRTRKGEITGTTILCTVNDAGDKLGNATAQNVHAEEQTMRKFLNQYKESDQLPAIG